MMKFALLCTVFVSMTAGVFAQQDPQFSQYQDYSAYINPSFMVNDYELNADVQHRQQWVGFPGRPISTLANVSYEVKKAHSAFGVTYLHDKLGAQENHNARLNYSGAIRFRGHTIAPGIYFGLIANSLDGSQLNPIQTGDPNIITSKQHGTVFDMGLGLSYRFKGLVFGVSMNHLTNQTLVYSDEIVQSEVKIARHLYTVIRYDFEIGKTFRLMPLTFFSTDITSGRIDNWLWVGFDNLNKYLQRVNIGVGHRLVHAVVVAAEWEFKWFRLGYSYDINLIDASKYKHGSHELTLRMHLFKSGGPKPETELE